MALILDLDLDILKM